MSANVKNLPKYVLPDRLCDEGATIKGDVWIASLDRVRDLLADDEGRVSLTLTFSRDERAFCCIKGDIHVNWNLVCQRCSGRIPQSEDITFMLAPVKGEAAIKYLPEDYEPWIMEDSKIFLNELIQEELLLNIPMVPMHDTKECKEVLKKFNLEQ